MKFTVIFVIALFGAASAGYNSGYENSGGRRGHSGGYNAIGSSGLRSVAEGSANRANSAVAQQQSAGRQASFAAKSTFAQHAVQAAATANAAFAGKTVLKENLEQQVSVALVALDQEYLQLEIAKQSAAASAAVAQQAQAQLNSLVVIKNSAEEVLRTTEATASAITTFLSSQTDGSEIAQGRIQELEYQLQAIRAEYAATKAATDKAMAAAHAARSNADAAAAQAALELESASAISSASHHDSNEESYKQSVIDVKSKWD